MVMLGRKVVKRAFEEELCGKTQFTPLAEVCWVQTRENLKCCITRHEIKRATAPHWEENTRKHQEKALERKLERMLERIQARTHKSHIGRKTP